MSEYNRIMCDLETLGKAPGSTILSIGACFFSSTAPEPIGPTFYSVISIDNSAGYGMFSDNETLQWWNEQSPEARVVLAQAAAQDAPRLRDVLANFSAWVTTNSATSTPQLWGNGSDFDNVILNAAYHVSGSAAAWWKFYNNRCYRTLKNLPAAKGTTIDRGTGTHHNALDDAVSQAKHAVQILKRMDDQAEKAWMYEGLCK